MSANVQDLTQRHEALKRDRLTWEADWKRLARHFLPRKCRLERTGGRADEGGIRGGTLDSTGYYAMRDLAAGLHGGMTSPARPWFKLALTDPALAGNGAVKRWTDAVEERMRHILHRSNFYNAVHHVYGELGTFGTAFIFCLEDERTGVRFTPLTAGEYCLDTDEHGRVDTVFRSIDMTVRQIIRRFPEANIPQWMLRLYETPSNWNTECKVVHAVYPRSDRRTDLGVSRTMPFVSVYWLDGMGSGGSRHGGDIPVILSEGGFRQFPGFGVRWDVTGNDVYGKSPAMDTLPDCVLLQQMTGSMLKALHKEIDPPMVGPADMGQISLLPGSFNPANPTGGAGQAVYPAVQVRHNIEATMRAIMQVQEKVREGLFNNLFRMMLNSDRRQITAREVAAREEEKLILIGPVLERLHDELFIPLIDRVFGIMAEGNMLPPWPEELAGAPLQVEFVSVLAQAQKMVATGAVEQFAGFVGSAVQLFPEVADAVNPDAVVDNYARYLGVEANMLRGQDERDQIRQARAEAQQQQMQQQQAMMGLDALQKNMSGSALEGILGGMGAAMEGREQ